MFDNQYNINNFKFSYKIYLKDKGYGSITVKNYLSDLSFFLKYYLSEASQKPSIQRMAEFLYNNGLLQFIEHQYSNKVNDRTINRRISSLKQFIYYLLPQFGLNPNSLSIPATVSQYLNLYHPELFQSKERLTKQFINDLSKEKLDKKTISNYSADIAEFLNFINGN